MENKEVEKQEQIKVAGKLGRIKEKIKKVREFKTNEGD